MRHLWERIGLNEALKGCRGYFPEIFAMVCQRLFAPNSKLHLNEWAPDTALSYLVGLRLQEPVPHRCYFALDRVITNREALQRVKAHVYICVISYLIHTAIEYLLKREGIQISADTLLERINRVKLITLTDKAHKVIVHKVTKKIDEEVKQSLSALGIKTIKAMYWRK